MSAREGRDNGSRVPPHNLEAEEALLGASLLTHEAIASAVEEGLAPEDFYKPAHARIWEAIVAEWSAGDRVDPVTVAERLARADLLDGVGGSDRLAHLTVSTPTIGGAGQYARIVRERHVLRRLIALGSSFQEMGYAAARDVPSIVAAAQEMAYALGDRQGPTGDSSMRAVLADYLDALERLYESRDAVTGTPSGWPDLDVMTLGWQPGSLVIVGGRPSMGKTALALGAAAHAAVDYRVPTVVFSLEMNRSEVAQRLIAALGHVDATRLRQGRLLENEWPRVTQATGRLAEAPLWIEDAPSTTLAEVRSKARRVKSQGGLGLVVVDYLQLMRHPKAENRQQEVAEISRGLKLLARDLEAPIVALSQLSRGLESRADKRPTLADLRDSGGIEQDADLVVLIYRDEVYHPDSQDKGLAEVILAKQRNGPTGTVKLAFLAHHVRFASMAKGSF